MDESIRLGRIAGVTIGLNWSVLLIAWLLSWSLASHRLPTSHPGHTTGAYWTAGVVTALVFFMSLLAHEMGHALVARRHGVRVEGITLWLFGGVAKLGGEAATPAAEFRIAAVGPAVSLALAGLFGGSAVLFDAVSAPSLMVGAATWLATINLMLAVFNLIPAAPLDGGRVLRALLWRRSGNRMKATVTAANAGRFFGYLLIVLGVVEFAAGASIGGLWFVFLGWFLLNAANAERVHAVMTDALTGVRVRDVMTADPSVVSESLTVDEFLNDHVMNHRWSTFPTTNSGGAITGLVTLGQVKAVPALLRVTTHVRDIACPIGQTAVASPGDAVTDLIERLSTCSDRRSLVFDGTGSSASCHPPTSTEQSNFPCSTPPGDPSCRTPLITSSRSPMSALQPVTSHGCGSATTGGPGGIST